MATSISDFTPSELRSLATIVMAIDDVDPASRETVIGVLQTIAGLDEVSQNALADVVELLGREKRAERLVEYLCSGQSLVDLQAEVWAAVDEDNATNPAAVDA
jgi:hypothetical protein